MQDGVKELIAQIRKEEREKIFLELKLGEEENKLKPFTEVSRYIDSWGEENEIPVRDLCKIKTATHTIVRYSLGIKRMTDLGEEQVELAKLIASDVLEMIQVTEEYK